MDNSIYVALSKQAAAGRQMEVIANNIANANTTGYKSEAMIFNQYLQKSGRGTDAYANDISTVRDQAQGTMLPTGNPLDLAIQGDGYFAVATPQGERYTRAGNFAINQIGELVSDDGYPVLDQSGQNIAFEPEDQKIVIFADGRMEVDGEDRGTIGVYNFDNKALLTKIDGNLYSAGDGVNAVVNEEPRIAQGMLESSNVNSILEMTKMISVQRDYDRTSKFINNMYELQETAIRTMAKEQ